MARKKARIEGVAAGAPLTKEAHMAKIETDPVPDAEETVPAAEDATPASLENYGIPPVEDIQAEPCILSVASVAEEMEHEFRLDPVAGIVEAALTDNFEVIEGLGNEGLHAAESLAGSYTENLLMFAAEATDYSKNCFERRAAFAGALLSAKSLENTVQFQSSYARSAYAQLMAHVMKMNGLYWNLVAQAARPAGRHTRALRAKA